VSSLSHAVVTLARRLWVPLGVLVAAGVAFGGARDAFLASPPQLFLQGEFGPAVMLAAGRGFGNPVLEPGTPLERFLKLTQPVLVPDDIGTPALVATNQFQDSHRYLLAAVGTWWRMTGIAWARIAEVAGVSHALATIAAFVLFRHLVPSGVALLAALAFAVSPLQLAFAPHLRDFIKAPFLLAGLAGVVALARRPMGDRQLLAVSAAIGAAIGLGTGFRMDVVVVLPVAAITILLFCGDRPWRDLRLKGLALSVLVAMMTLAAWPVLSRMSSEGSNAFHFLLLGYSDWFNGRLRVEAAPYSFLPFYSDHFVHHLVRVRAFAAAGVDAPLPSAAYDAAAFDLWWQWVRHFPADAYTRLLAAVDGVLNLAFDNPGGPPGVSNTVAQWLNGWRGWGALLGAALIAAAAWRGWRLALFSAFVIVAATGYPSLQYDPRHYFHLQVVPVAILALLGWRAATAAHACLRGPVRVTRADALAVARAAPRPALTAVVVGLLVLLPAPALRAYQAQHVSGLLAEFLRQPRVHQDVTVRDLGSGRSLLQWTDVEGRPTGLAGLRFAYVVADFRVDAPGSALAVGLRYAEGPNWRPCAVTRTVVSGPGVARFLVPVHSADGGHRFEGMEVGPEMRRRLMGVSLAPMEPGGLPMAFHLAADWQSRRLTQRLVLEGRLRADDSTPGAFAPDHCGSLVLVVDATLDPRLALPPVLAIDADRARLDAGTLIVAGRAGASREPLARFGSVDLGTDDAIVARLQIDDGSAVIGLWRDGVLVSEAFVPRRGINVVRVAPPGPGVYDVVIANGPPGWRPAVALRLDRLGIVTADGVVVPLEWRR
jgi:hypothetical protein